MKLIDFVSQSGRGQGVALARTLEVSQPTVSDWCTGKKRVPVERCVPIERATAGAVTRKDLRPEDWAEIWPEAAQADWRPVGAAEPVTAAGA